MRVEKVKVFATIFEIEEYQAMEKVEEVLGELVEKFGTEHSLISAETGEAVGIGELLRVRGILSCLSKYRCWEVYDEPINLSD